MAKSLSLALYLATRARPARQVVATPGTVNSNQQKERLGTASVARPQGPLIWFHTGGDRHALAVRELAHRLRQERDDLTFLLTTSTEKKRRKSKDYLKSRYVPDENLPAVRRFLGHWRPDIAVWTEADLRPALITDAARRHIPLFMLDARTAAPVVPSRWWRGVSGSILSRFQHVVTGDEKSATSLKRLGADPSTLEVSGFLEEGTGALPCNEADRDALAQRLGGRPVWLAASTDPSELEPVIAAHQHAQRRAHRLLLILQPGMPEHGRAWRDMLHADGYGVALRSAGEEPGADTQIYLADTADEAGLWYRLAPISFLGQSLAPGGGINPFEAAALGSAIMHGPNTRNFRRAYAALDAAGASRLVRNGDDLATEVERLLSPDAAAAMAHQAWKVSSSGAEVTDRAIDLILTKLDELSV